MSDTTHFQDKFPVNFPPVLTATENIQFTSNENHFEFNQTEQGQLFGQDFHDHLHQNSNDDVFNQVFIFESDGQVELNHIHANPSADTVL